MTACRATPASLDVAMGPGAGGGTLILGGNNRFCGGTDVQDGTLPLDNEANSRAGASLGTAAATIDSIATLDLSGCPLTLSSFRDYTRGDGGTIRDDASGLRGSPVGVTPLTIDNSLPPSRDGMRNVVDAPASPPPGCAGHGGIERGTQIAF